MAKVKVLNIVLHDLVLWKLLPPLIHSTPPMWSFFFFFFFSPLDLQVEKAMATHSSTLAWRIPWTEEPGGLQSVGSLRVRHKWVTSLSLFTFKHWRRKWQPTPVFLPGESQGQGSLVGCRPWGRTESDNWSDLAAAADLYAFLTLNFWYNLVSFWHNLVLSPALLDHFSLFTFQLTFLTF